MFGAMPEAPMMSELDLMVAENLPHLSTVTNEIDSQTPRVRSNFPETWLWQMLEAG